MRACNHSKLGFVWGLRRLLTPIGLIHLARRPAESRPDLKELLRGS